MNLDFLIFAHNNSFDTKILKLDGAHGAKLDFNLESNWILYFGFKYIYIYIYIYLIGCIDSWVFASNNSIDTEILKLDRTQDAKLDSNLEFNLIFSMLWL